MLYPGYSQRSKSRAAVIVSAYLRAAPATTSLKVPIRRESIASSEPMAAALMTVPFTSVLSVWQMNGAPDLFLPLKLA